MPGGIFVMFRFPNGELMHADDWTDLYEPEDGRYLDGRRVWHMVYGVCFGFSGKGTWEGQPRGTYRVDIHDSGHKLLISNPFELQ